MAKLFLILSGLTLTNCDVSPVEVLNNKIYDMPDLRAICGNFKNVDDVNVKCAEQLNIVCGNLTLLLTMLEASSSFPFTGSGYATNYDLGNFDQCLTVDHVYEGGRILGEHCTKGLIAPNILEDIYDADTYFKLSVCRPNACSASDYNAVVKNLMDPAFPELFEDVNCQTKYSNTTFIPEDIVTLTIFLVVMWLMVTSTLYDIYNNYMIKNESARPLFMAYSILSNGRKLIRSSKNAGSKEEIHVFQGIRVISMMWIVAGHGFLSWEKIPVADDRAYSNYWRKQLYAGYIITAALAVDTFFYMSGFLVSYLYLKSREKTLIDQVLYIPVMYVHRYMRLTPALLMVYLVVISIFRHLGSGPLWTNTEDSAKICKDNWWAFFLYVQNLHNYGELICLSQTWFLSSVMQMFVLSPLILIPISQILRKPAGLEMSMVVLLVINVLCTVGPLAYKLYVMDPNDDYDTYSRFISYTVGLMLGVIMRETINKPFLYMINERHRPIINIVTWVLILLGMLTIAICYQLIEINNEYIKKIVFSSLMRPAWGIGLSWIIYSCQHGYGGFVNWILCRPIYQVLGRLTYCIYLLHQPVINYYVASTKVSSYFNDYYAFYSVCGHYVLSVILAIFWTLAFEMPLIVIEKYVIRADSKFPRYKANGSQSAEEAQNVTENITTGTLVANNVEAIELSKI